LAAGFLAGRAGLAFGRCRPRPTVPSVVFSNLGISEVASSFRRTRHLDDATVLRAAAAYEAAAPWKDKWPPMLAQMGL
jgi:hypothetical protein